MQTKQNLAKQTLSSEQGFSLIEILIALTLLATASTFVAGKMFQSHHEGMVSSAKIQMQSLSERLKEFRRHCNSFPTGEQGLEALVSKPSGGKECKRYAPEGYIDGELPLDPWDNDFIYESNGKTFNISSYGADMEEGGEGNDADIFLKKPKL